MQARFSEVACCNTGRAVVTRTFKVTLEVTVMP